ncbi:putative baseplate assembly protein [Streptomyces sp. NPDC001657]|uniref:putative baseplate assembly protein n=1 Tax=Streptomyces sp. NPDC001657 TaxID=3154522 RepID=UPI0033271F91
MTELSCGCSDPGPAPGSALVNPPGLNTLAYRIGTHGSFKAAMLRALGTDPVLRRLATRDDSDPLIALLDACASMLDVLTFYQERIANEGFLRTARERLSVLELARTIGYELRPGVAASTALAFTLTEPARPVSAPGGDVPGAMLAATTPLSVRLAVGTKAQSIPLQDGLPRTFETVEEIEARPEWNALRVPATARTPPTLADSDLQLDGSSTGLALGDALVLRDTATSEAAGVLDWSMGRVVDVRTVGPAGTVPAHTAARLENLRPAGSIHLSHPAQIYAMRTRAAVFGHNAVPWRALPAPLRVGERVVTGQDPEATEFRPGLYADRENSWADAALTGPTVRLDRVHPGITRGSWVVLASPEQVEMFTVDKAVDETVEDFLMQTQVTVLTLTGGDLSPFTPRNTTVYARPEELTPADRPVTDAVSGRVIPLAGPLLTVPPRGRLVAVRGRRADTDAEASEVRRISTADSGEHPVLRLAEELEHRYAPDSVRINANVASATDGDSRTEILGSGDGSVAFPGFVLHGKPLTYVSAPTPTGGLSTLTIKVDGVPWTEVGTLRGQPPDARVYLTRRADDGTVTVRFGDGKTGARLPTGKDNVVAEYRIGTGLAGNLGTGRISLPLSRPLGLQDVINPVPATGAEDPESLSRARGNAPATVLALDRIVSLRDYENFARCFLGIGKAKASADRAGERGVVRLVVATGEGQPLDPSSQLHAHLADGIDAARHPRHRVRIDAFRPRPFVVDLALRIAAGREREAVLAAVTGALVQYFAFDVRDFGQPVAPSEVLGVAQDVEGVRGAVLRALRFADESAPPTGPLPAEPDQLLTLSATDVLLTDISEPRL